jgi:hypothetical protein
MLGGILHIGSERGIREALLSALSKHEETTGVSMERVIAVVQSQILTQDYSPQKRGTELYADPHVGFPAGTDFTAQ